MTCLPGLSTGLRAAMLVLTISVGVLTAFLTSDVTKVGTAVHRKLAEPNLGLKAAGVSVAGLSVLLLFMGFLLDILLWVKWKVVTYVWEVATVCFVLVDLLILTPWFPPAPLIVGMVVNIVGFRILKKSFGLDHRRERLQLFLSAVIMACVVTAAVLLAFWLAWLIPGITDKAVHVQSAYSPEVQKDFKSNNAQKGALVRFVSPVILAYHYLVAAVCTWMRKVFEAHKDETNDGSVHFGVALYVSLVILMASLAVTYGALSLSPYSDLIGRIALYFGVATAVSILVYLGYVIGGQRILAMAMTDDTMKKAIDLLYSDYAKAGVALVCLPFLPLVFAVGVLHQSTRRCLWRCELIPPEDSATRNKWLTKELQHIWGWEKGTVFLLVMYLGIAVVLFRTIAAVVPPFMAWLSMSLASEGLPTVLLVSFAVSIVMFLLPPVSGQMIYIPISLIIIEKQGYEDAGQLTLAILVATLFCLIMKLVASGMQQKLIGAPFAKNIAVKKTFNLHTAPYRVARSILSQPGMSFRKVVFLTGMPDWPVSVLCGVLGLPLFPVLLGTTPEFFKILPNCISMGFLMKSREMSPQQDTFFSLFQAFFLMGIGVPGVLTLLTGIIVKRVMVSHKDEFNNPSSDWYRDPQEAEIVARIEEDRVKAEEEERLTSWKAQPVCVRAVLCLGAFLASASVYMIATTPFESFDFKDPNALDKLPGGSLKGLVRKEGYAMLALMAAVCVCLTIFKLWACYATKAQPDVQLAAAKTESTTAAGENSPLGVAAAKTESPAAAAGERGSFGV